MPAANALHLLQKETFQSWVQALIKNIKDRREPGHKIDRLLEVLDDPEVEELLTELGPAEARHWRMFHGLAGVRTGPDGTVREEPHGSRLGACRRPTWDNMLEPLICTSNRKRRGT